MKLVKRVSSFILALLMVITVLAVPTPVEAATKKATVVKQIRIAPKTFSSIEVTYANEYDKIKNLKSSSKNLVVRQIIQQNSYSPRGTIQMYAKKTGKYTVKFDVYSKSGKKRSSHKVTVYAKNDSPLASVQLDGQDILKDPLFNKTSAKLSVKMAKGYKLKKIEVGTFDIENKSAVSPVSYTKKVEVKNNSKIKLSKYPQNYYYGNSSFSFWTKGMCAYTYIYITYIDKYTKEEDTVTCSVNRLIK